MRFDLLCTFFAWLVFIELIAFHANIILTFRTVAEDFAVDFFFRFEAKAAK